MRGKCEGLPVTYRHVDRSGGDLFAAWWTEVEVEIPKVPLALYLRRAGAGDHEQVAQGGMVDVAVGDAAFDAAFVVEGAPAELVVQLLDEDLRELLLGLDDTAVLGAKPGFLCLSFHGQLNDPDAAFEIIHGVARAGARAARFSAADAAADPYRRGPQRNLAAEADHARSVILARHESVFEVSASRVIGVIAVVVLLLWLVFG
jgi:hypothetical protein